MRYILTCTTCGSDDYKFISNENGISHFECQDCGCVATMDESDGCAATLEAENDE